MASTNVKLIGTWSCPYVNRVQLSLSLKSVEYDFIEDNAYKKSEMLLKYNPVHKKIPVLVHGESPVCESLVIVEYIDDAWSNGSPILPSDAHDRALARFWTAYIDSKWYPLLKVLRLSEDKEEQTRLVEEVHEGLVLLEEAFVNCSKGKAFFGGDSIGYVDIVLGSCLGWLKVTEKVVEVQFLDPTKFPGLVKWADRFCSDKAVKAVCPEIQKLAELHKMIQAFIKASKS